MGDIATSPTPSSPLAETASPDVTLNSIVAGSGFGNGVPAQVASFERAVAVESEVENEDLSLMPILNRYEEAATVLENLVESAIEDCMAEQGFDVLVAAVQPSATPTAADVIERRYPGPLRRSSVLGYAFNSTDNASQPATPEEPPLSDAERAALDGNIVQTFTLKQAEL